MHGLALGHNMLISIGPRTRRKVNRANAAGQIFKVLICGMISFAAASALGAEHRFDGVYTGKRSLTKGSGQMCPVKEDVFVTISGETLSFTNSVLKKFVIGFYPREDGSFSRRRRGAYPGPDNRRPDRG